MGDYFHRAENLNELQRWLADVIQAKGLIR